MVFKKQSTRQQPVRRFREHPIVEQFNLQGRVLDSMADLSDNISKTTDDVMNDLI